jgi:hypothetical protein
MGRRVIHMEFWWEQEGQRPIMRPIRRWEDNIKMYLREINGVTWIRIIWLKVGTSGMFF